MKEETKRLLTACFLTLFIVIFIFAQRGLLKETNIVKWDFTLRSLFNNKATIFLLKNRIDIILVVLMIILISVIFTTSEFKPNKLQPRVQNTVVIEGLTTLNDSEKTKMVEAVVDELIARYKCGTNACNWDINTYGDSKYDQAGNTNMKGEWDTARNIIIDDYDKYLGSSGYQDLEGKIFARFKEELDKISSTYVEDDDLENIKATLLAVGKTEIARVDTEREDLKQQQEAGIMIPDICDDELQKLRPIYEDEIARGIGSYNNNMTDLREQINDGKNITLTEDEIRNKISGLKTNNIQLQQDISYYISRRKGNCEMDTNKDGIITTTESGTMFGGSMQGFTNMFSKNTFKEALQTLKQDRKLLENMDNQYNKTNSDIETDLIKNEYRTGAYALGIVIVGGLIVSRFQNK